MSSKIVQLALLLALLAAASGQSCSSSQFYAFNGSCVDCPANCTTCSNAEFCTACKDTFFLVSNSFNVTCQTCSKIFVGCLTCLSNVACTKCAAGYFISGGICTPCSAKNLFCAECSADGSNCTVCSYPFILYNNLCVSAVVSNITGAPNPAAAQNASTPAGNTTANTTKLVTLANGTKVPEVLDANSCNQIEIFYQGRCIRSIPRCKLYQPSGLCAYCESGYIVTLYGDCSVKNRFLRCEQGYWLNQDTDSCVKVSVACDFYYPNNGSCLNCSSGYKMEEGKCVQAVNCSSRQFFFEGSCIDVQPQCTAFKSDGACTACQQGYKLAGGLCVIQQNTIVGGSNCNFPCNTCHFADSKFCFSCAIYYQLSGAKYGTCIPVLS